MSMAYTVTAVLLLASAAVLFMVWRERQSGRRGRAIHQFLDMADALEAELQRCRQRMQELQAWVAGLPGDGSREASDRLAAGESVQVALKQLLGHRLWLKDHAGTAPVQEIVEANQRLERSRDLLAQQMARLEQMREELERASEAHARAVQVPPRQVEVEGKPHTLH